MWTTAKLNSTIPSRSRYLTDRVMVNKLKFLSAVSTGTAAQNKTLWQRRFSRQRNFREWSVSQVSTNGFELVGCEFLIIKLK